MTSARILIIDDDADFCEELEDSLQGEGYSSEAAHDAIEGEELIRSGKFDVILLDCKMPLRSGIDILNNLKADKIARRIFIISGKPHLDRTLKDEGLSNEVSGIISKPVDFDVLLDKIRGL